MNNRDELENELEGLGDTSELDNLLLSEGNEDDLVEKMNDQQEKAAIENTPWMQDFSEHWFWYLILGLSFLLTETTAIYLGLAPYLTTDPADPAKQVIHWNTDIGHLATALVYMLLFPAVTELAFDRAWKKYSKREPRNLAQMVTMIVAIVASAIAILGTGVAGFYVVFATLGSLGFLEIPHSVQVWLIFIVPSLLALNAILHGIYKAKSKIEKLNRLVDDRIQKSELSDRLRNKMTEQKAKRAIRAVARRSYIRAVAMGLLSQKEADDAMAHGKSLVQLEKELNRDLTGEGKIGDTSGLHRQLPGPSPRVVPDAPEQKYTTDEFCELWQQTRAGAAELLKQFGNDVDECFEVCSQNGYLPFGMTRSNFADIYYDLMSRVHFPRPFKVSTIVSNNGDTDPTKPPRR